MPATQSAHTTGCHHGPARSCTMRRIAGSSSTSTAVQPMKRSRTTLSGEAIVKACTKSGTQARFATAPATTAAGAPARAAALTRPCSRRDEGRRHAHRDVAANGLADRAVLGRVVHEGTQLVLAGGRGEAHAEIA